MHLNPRCGVIGTISGCACHAHFALSSKGDVIGTCAVARSKTGEVILTFSSINDEPWLAITVRDDHVITQAVGQAGEELHLDTSDGSKMVFVIDPKLKLQHNRKKHLGRRLGQIGTSQLFLNERLLVSGETDSGVNWTLTKVEFE